MPSWAVVVAVQGADGVLDGVVEQVELADGLLLALARLHTPEHNVQVRWSERLAFQ